MGSLAFDPVPIILYLLSIALLGNRQHSQIMQRNGLPSVLASVHSYSLATRIASAKPANILLHLVTRKTTQSRRQIPQETIDSCMAEMDTLHRFYGGVGSGKAVDSIFDRILKELEDAAALPTIVSLEEVYDTSSSEPVCKSPLSVHELSDRRSITAFSYELDELSKFLTVPIANLRVTDGEVVSGTLKSLVDYWTRPETQALEFQLQAAYGIVSFDFEQLADG